MNKEILYRAVNIMPADQTIYIGWLLPESLISLTVYVVYIAQSFYSLLANNFRSKIVQSCNSHHDNRAFIKSLL